MVTGLRFSAAILALAALVSTGCAPLPRRVFASARQADYFAARRELSPEVARAIEAGHLLIGMDVEQVWVVLGDPVRKAYFDRSATEVWIYRAGRLHQDQLHTHGNEPFRLVFINKRLVLIETL